MKINLYIVFSVILLLSLTSAQTPEGLDAESLQNDSVVKNIEKLQEFTEEEKWKFIGEQWQEALLKNKFISTVDSFFKKINIVFKIVLARDYALSLTLFFSFLLWLIAFMKLPKYLLFLHENWMKTLVSLAISIGIAHTQFFNKIAELFFKLIFFKSEWYWRTLSALAILIGFIIYYAIIAYFGKYLEAQKIKKEKLKEKVAAKKVEKIAEGLEEYGSGI